MNIENVYKDFLFWINGITEDDPIPYEIKSLIFFININYEIGFSGSENLKIDKIDFDFYFPLEAEYFFCTTLYTYIFTQKDREKSALKILNTLLKKLKKENGYKNLNLYYGFLFDKAFKTEKNDYNKKK